MKVSIAAADWSHFIGEVLEVEDDLAEKWAKVGHCKILKRGVDNGNGINAVLPDGTVGDGALKPAHSASNGINDADSGKITP